MVVYIIGAILVLLIIYAFLMFNSFAKLHNKVKEAFSTMDVYLKKRWDLIPNLVEIVKGYTKHESNTLEEVINLRNSTYDSMSNDEKVKTNKELSKGINKIMALVESYPDLKANESFLSLQKDLSKIEDEIAQSRKYYNGTVRLFNNKVEIFPNNIFAKLFGYKSKAMFEVNIKERENVKVNF